MSAQPRRGLPLALALVMLLPLVGATHDPLNPLDTHDGVPDLLPWSDDAEPSDESTLQKLCGSVSNVGANSIVVTPFNVELRVDDFPVNATLVTERLPTGHGVHLCWTLGAPLTRGYHHFTIVADSDEDVPESNETNNVARPRWFWVGNAPMPELRVKSFYVQPRVAKPGQHQAFVVQVENAGRAAAPATRFEMRDETGLLGEGEIPGLEPRATQRFAILTNPDVRPVGNFTAYVLLDLMDAAKETNELNNDAYSTYEIPPHPMPDLVVRSLNLTGDLVARRGLSLNVTFANEGDLNAYRPVLRLMQGNASLANATRSTLVPGANGSVTFHFVLPAGQHELRVAADPDSAIFESDETNNLATLNVTIAPEPADLALPNLVVRSLDAAPTDPGPDEPVLLTALVHNPSTKPANATQVSFFVDGKLLGKKPVPSLKPESWYNVAFAWGGGSEGDHDLRVQVDPDGAVNETDEKDNVLTSYVALLPPTPKTPPPTTPPDLPPDGTPPTDGEGEPPETPPTGEDDTPPVEAPEKPKVNVGELTIKTTPVPGGLKGVLVVSLRNPTLEQVPRMSVAFTVDGQPLKEVLMTGLAPAATASASSGEVDLPAGKHVIKAEVRVLGTDVRASTEATYQAEEGGRGIPGPGVLLFLVAAGTTALALRRTRRG